MNGMVKLGMQIARKAYAHSFLEKPLARPACIRDPEVVAEMIGKVLAKDEPVMIARLGSTELTCLWNYLGVKQEDRRVLDYIKGKVSPWWWKSGIISQMQQWSGFFPPTEEKVEQFCKLMLEDIPFVDILGSWLPHENYFEEQLKNAEKVQLLALDPFWAKEPWTKALEGKKVLVVHPFTETITAQYKKRKHLFANNLLPEFELKTVKAVQSIAGEKTPFADWFEALDYMKNEINQIDYDICLIGAGAYGFPLAAHVKRMGKKGFHIGGSLQLLFGIRGKRWESPNYHHTYNYPGLVNKYWVSPNEREKPTYANRVEGGCYW